MICLEEILEGAQSAGIAGHVRPDGDAVGSCLGLWMYLQEYYPQIRSYVHLESIRPEFRFLKGADQVLTDSPDASYDVFFILDCGDPQRLGSNAKYVGSARKTVCIDHHLSNCGFADLNEIRPQVSSTSEIICDLAGEGHITQDMARALYMGLVHDTGCFRYACSSHTLELAGRLIDLGIDYSRIVDETFDASTFAEQRLLGLALTGSRLYFDGKVILAKLSGEEIAREQARYEDAHGIVGVLRCTSGIEAAIFLYEIEPGTVRVSMRSCTYLDCIAVTSRYGGGGHKKAAGCTLHGSLEKVTETILEAVRPLIKPDP